MTVLAVTTICLLVAGSGWAQPISTPFWTSFFGDGLTFNGNILPVGATIDAFDPDGVHCGTWTVTTAGKFGFMSVFGDDPTDSLVDEGAVTGDSITFKIAGVPASVDSGDVTWEDKTQKFILLSATGTVSLTPVDLPDSARIFPGDTVRMFIGIENSGNVLDFYSMTLGNSNPLFDAIGPSAFVYNAAGDTVFVAFDVISPIFPGDSVNTVSYEVFSNLDPTQRVIGTAKIIVSISTDVGDDDGLLPGSFSLAQNFPNPFNPSTTISFTLPQRSSVHLGIYDALGREAHTVDLGSLSSGEHSVDFSADNLASGVYFYRILTESGSLTRKMVLLK